MQFTTIHFNALTATQLYSIIKMRNEIFVLEQQCLFQDADDKDQQCYHCLYFEEKKLIAYARLLPPGLAYKEASIGRVAVAKQVRNNGTGKLLLQHCIQECQRLFNNTTITIGAQLYLQNFYASFLFKPVGDIYIEDNIAHIQMLRS
jgi:ElaA protein